MKRARRREAPTGDMGPDIRHRNGTARLSYRADPDKPNAPDIRAARAFVNYENWHSLGLISDPEREAADRIAVAAEAVTGANCGDSGGLKGRAFWEVGGPGPRAVQAASDLRSVARELGPALSGVVYEAVVLGQPHDVLRVKFGLGKMATLWQME